MGHVTGFVFLCLPEELWLACRADRTVSSSLIVFEQKLFETVSEDPHLCDCGCSNVWGKNWVRMIPNTWRSVCSLFGVMMMRRVVQDVFFFFFLKAYECMFGRDYFVVWKRKELCTLGNLEK